MLSTLPGMVTDVRPAQWAKAELPMVCTPSSITRDVRPLQPLNAYSPMLVTLSGIVTEVRPVQLEKAELPMVCTPSSITREVRPLQPLNAELPMVCTLPGIVTDVRLRQSLNAESPMAVTATPSTCPGMTASVTVPWVPVTVPVASSTTRSPPDTG